MFLNSFFKCTPLFFFFFFFFFFTAGMLNFWPSLLFCGSLFFRFGWGGFYFVTCNPNSYCNLINDTDMLWNWNKLVLIIADIISSFPQPAFFGGCMCMCVCECIYVHGNFLLLSYFYCYYYYYFMNMISDRFQVTVMKLPITRNDTKEYIVVIYRTNYLWYPKNKK